MELHTAVVHHTWATTPITGFITTALNLYDHFYLTPWELEYAVWDCSVIDEPGGISVRITPEGEEVKISIFQHQKEWRRPGNKLPDIDPVAEGVIEYWDFSDAVADELARIVVREGFTGLRRGWLCEDWTDEEIDSLPPVIPLPQFFYLITLVRDRSHRLSMSFDEEIELLNELRKKYQGG